MTAFFWITKVLTTAMGESTSDFLVHRMDPVIAVCLGAPGLAVALALQSDLLDLDLLAGRGHGGGLRHDGG